ncbi:MAG: putative enzyme related to lactoylglutathione lyase [Moritella dasanensis]|jgi:predicted enzyme related to lactoylglutathione lyase
MDEQNKINYVEFPAFDIVATKHFFETVFKWSFENFGPDYAAFTGQGINGGFYRSESKSLTSNGAALIVIYSHELAFTQAKVEQAGGLIVKQIFNFPGGRRFQFIEPSGNELAVWSDRD